MDSIYTESFVELRRLVKSTVDTALHRLMYCRSALVVISVMALLRG